jgi:fructose-1,6-bisphosphatase-3
MLKKELVEEDLRYLKLLAVQFPSIQAASSEIINLSANLQLPKGTEHFLSDIHGEYEAFAHVIKSGSGSIQRRIDELFSNEMTEAERQGLAVLIYYPKQKLSLVLKKVDDPDEWFRITLFRLIRLCRVIASKYSRTAVRESLPPNFAFILEELLHEQEGMENKQAFYQGIIDTIISIGSAEAFIVALSEVIQRLAIAHLHILGDIFDRSPGAHHILDDLLRYHSVDAQWGNHDILWMGAAAGSEACIANVIRISLRYSNLETLENGYAISLLPLASFAMDVYGDDPCARFEPKVSSEDTDTEYEWDLVTRMHKAIAIIQLKLEGQLIQRRPQFQMQNRLLLDKLDLERGIVRLDGEEYPLLDTNFPTIDPQNPYELSSRERSVVEKLRLSFQNSERLQTHVRFLLSKGSMFLTYNGNLLYHGCIPMNPDGSLAEFEDEGVVYCGRSFMDHLDLLVRQGYFSRQPERRLYGQDIMWYLWGGARSPLFGKERMTTFEQYFLADKKTHLEKKNPYYQYRDQEETAVGILKEFGLDPQTGHIVNGHVPVEVKKGESPIKAGGKLLVIDGGFAKAYQAKTGIAGYTLIFNSYGLLLASHEPFVSVESVLDEKTWAHPRTQILEMSARRMRVMDTDQGKTIQARIDDLKALLNAYRAGYLQEQ